jgi:hypothetical protein
MFTKLMHAIELGSLNEGPKFSSACPTKLVILSNETIVSNSPSTIGQLGRPVLVDNGGTPRSALRTRAFTPPAYGSFPPAIGPFSSRWSNVVMVALFQVKINLFNNELALLVLLTLRVGLLIGPSDQILAALAKDVTYSV